MKSILEIALYIALGATFIVMTMGIIHLFRKNKGDSQKSNQLMRLRVIFQAVALGILALLLLMKKS
jgi:tetrahydromethanopterin S-methyltransferase subunit C